jgi:uncharacterized repeat protein (TIGR01451 family)
MTGVRRLVIMSVLLVVALVATASPAAAAPGSPFTKSGPFVVAPSDPADLSLEITDSQDPVNVNESWDYTFSATNNGPDPATNVTITVLISDALNVGTPPSGCTVVHNPPNGTTVTCTRASLASGATANFTLTVTPTLAGLYSAEGDVTSSTPDPNTGNNHASQFTNVSLPEAVPAARRPH